MIFFIVQRGHEYTLRNFTDSWGRRLRGRISILNYNDLAYARRLRGGTYVFTDHDRLGDAQIELGGAVADQLARGGCKVISNPMKVARRTEFLHRLVEAGVNEFRAFAVKDGIPADLRFPVFIRLANEHKGSIGDLIRDRDQLAKAIADSGHAGSPHLLVVEFCDTRDACGTYRKYGATRIGERIVPRHAFASKHWMVKLNDEVNADWVEHEQQYFGRFEADFAAPLRRIFDLAGVEYGRLDFSLKDGQIRAWEINTNPMLVNTPDVIHVTRLVLQAESARAITDAVEALDAPNTGANGQMISISVPAELRRRAGVTATDWQARQFGKILNRLRMLPGVRSLISAGERARWLANQ